MDGKYDSDTVRQRVKEILSCFSLSEIDMSLTPGERLRTLRQAAGLSIRKLARCSGISTDTIINAEYGRKYLRLPSAVKLAKVFGISPGVLMLSNTPSGRGELSYKVLSSRLLLGLKQNEFAELLGVNPSSIRDWELGKREIAERCLSLLEIVECLAFETLTCSKAKTAIPNFGKT